MTKTQPKTRRAGVNDLSDEQKAELRERAEALAAEYSARLPEGDAGLIEADRQLQEYRPRETVLYREFNIDVQTEGTSSFQLSAQPRTRSSITSSKPLRRRWPGPW
jgi:hypothetical protein